MKDLIGKAFIIGILAAGILSYIQMNKINHVDTVQDKDVVARDSTSLENGFTYKPDVQLLNSIVSGVKRVYEITIKY